MTGLRRITARVAALLLLAASAHAGPPAALAPPSAGLARAEASFDRFAREWMEALGQTAAGQRRSALQRVALRAGSERSESYLGVTRDFEIELRPTGVAASPYVGILRYSELTYRCASDAAGACHVVATTPITEIFRLKGGRWIY